MMDVNPTRHTHDLARMERMRSDRASGKYVPSSNERRHLEEYWYFDQKTGFKDLFTVTPSPIGSVRVVKLNCILLNFPQLQPNYHVHELNQEFRLPRA